MVSVVTVLLAAVTATPASAVPDDPDAKGAGPTAPLEQAREESSVADRPRTRAALPAGDVRLSASELLAAGRQRLELSAVLDRDVTEGTLEITLPRLWTTRATPSDLPYARVPETGTGSGTRADARRSGRVVTLAFTDARAGDAAEFALTDAGIPAGTYALAYRWRERGRSETKGALKAVFYAPTREASETAPEWTRLANPGFEQNATNDAGNESETFLTVVPGNRRRFAVGANGGGGLNAWLTDDGQSFTKLSMPALTDAPAEANPEASNLCCDPMSAADADGDIWYGGLSFDNGAGQPSRIVVNRIAAGTQSFQPLTVGLPQRTTGTQDKPMMTIDDSPSSPHFGRLYVVWNEPAAGGGINVVISQCDTRPGGVPNAPNCDNADNWSAPASVTPFPGSYIYSDVAASPDGTANVVWWDYSAANAIRGDTCPAAANCAVAAAWGTPQTIATLDATGGSPVPFACPILAQPGGRAATSPQLDVDRSGGANNGRVYVTWSDLRTGSGTTRCAEKTPPVATHLTWDSFVASAPGGLPGSAGPSPTVATRLLTDGEGGGQANSDDWFPWLAIDQTTGQAWADFYSTRDDLARRTTNFYVRTVTPAGGGHTLGALTKVSSQPSDYSGAGCCSFGNDYGDYTGIDATQGIALPVWSDKRDAGDGEAFTFVAAEPVIRSDAVTVTDPAGDNDGRLEPGEPFALTQRLRNIGVRAATGVSATLTKAQPELSLTQPASAYPDIAAGATQANATQYAGALAAEAPCGRPVTMSLEVTSAQGTYTVPVSVPTGSPTALGATCSPPPPAPSLTATAPASPAPDTTPQVSGTAPGGSTVRLYTDAPCTGTPAATGTAAGLAAPGIEVTVPAGRTTQIRATATLGGLTSVCSPPIAYAEGAAPPPPPATTPTPAPAPAPTIPGTTPPRARDRSVALTLTAAAAQRAVRQRALKLTVLCAAEPCVVSATGVVSVPASTRRPNVRRVSARPAAKALRKGQRTTLSLALSASLRRQLQRALRDPRTRGRIRATIAGTAVDAAGNRQTKRKTIRVRR